MNKIGAEIAWNAIILIIIALIAATIIIFIFNSQARKGGNVSEGYLDDLKRDCDGDGIKNAIDECPCSPLEKQNGVCQKPDTNTCGADYKCP